MSVQAAPEVDLSQSRSAAELLSLSLSLFSRHAGLFLSVTLLIVAPVVILVDGVWGGALRDGVDYGPGTGASLASLFLTSFVTPALVTALHAVIVRDLGAGRVVTVGQALRAAAPTLPRAVAVVTLSTLGVVLGLVALIVPGVWLAVRWYFGAQAAVLEGLGPAAALRRSAAQVRDRWLETFGALLLCAVAFGLAGFVLMMLASILFYALDSPLLFTVALAIVQAVAVSCSALFSTLLWFSHRATRP